MLMEDLLLSPDILLLEEKEVVAIFWIFHLDLLRQAIIAGQEQKGVGNIVVYKHHYLAISISR